MNITKQQKQLFWICLILVVAAYLYHSVVIAVQRHAYYQRQARIAQMRRQARAKAAAAKPKAVPVATPPPTYCQRSPAQPTPSTRCRSCTQQAQWRLARASGAAG